MPVRGTTSGNLLEEVGQSTRRLLCEGWIEEGCEHAAVELPELAYCRQGNKLWVAYGDKKGLDESTTDAQIVERLDELELEERNVPTIGTVRMPKNGKWIVEGPAQRSDVKNANQRVYPRKLWEKLIGDPKSYVQQQIAERAMTGHLEHPKDGRSDLNETAILTLESKLLEDGTVWNKFEIIEDTPKGQILQALTARRVRWGVSSRGNGTVDDSGMVSESDYVLKTWDAVAAPSTPGAYAKLSGSLGEGQLREGYEETIRRKLKSNPQALKLMQRSIEALDGDVEQTAGFCIELMLGVRGYALVDPMSKLFRRLIVAGPSDDTENTAESAQGALSDRAKASLEALTILVESESDGLDRKGRAKRADSLLHMLSSLDESTAAELLVDKESWAIVQRGVGRAREILADTQASDTLDEAIEQALTSGETSEEQNGLMHVVEALQAQVEDSVTETTALRGRLEAAESANRELREVHEEALEQLSRTREELALTERAHDLTCGLLAEATARPDGDRRADAKVDELVAERPDLTPYRSVLLEAARTGQADTLADSLAPRTPPVSEDTRDPVLASRSSLPAGIVESYDAPAPRSRSANTSEGARLAGRALAGTQKS